MSFRNDGGLLCFQTVTFGEVLSPFVMMLVLSIVHSQIVSTTTISKKNFLKTSRSRSPRRANRGHSTTSSKTKSKYISRRPLSRCSFSQNQTDRNGWHDFSFD